MNRFLKNILAAGLVALLAIPGAVRADDRREGVAYLQVVDVTDTTWAGSGGTVTSDTFYLGKSEFYSAQVEVTTTGTPNYDMIFQFEKSDGTFVDDPDGDVVTSSSAAYDVVTLTPEYFTNGLRLKLTNDDTSFADVKVFIHRDAPRKGR